MEFFSNARAAASRSPFEHQRFQSGSGEIAGRDQSIVTGADDNYSILECAGRAKRRLRFWFVSSASALVSNE